MKARDRPCAAERMIRLLLGLEDGRGRGRICCAATRLGDPFYSSGGMRSSGSPSFPLRSGSWMGGWVDGWETATLVQVDTRSYWSSSPRLSNSVAHGVSQESPGRCPHSQIQIQRPQSQPSVCIILNGLHFNCEVALDG